MSLAVDPSAFTRRRLSVAQLESLEARKKMATEGVSRWTSGSTTVQDFVARQRGHTPITRVLIANNGVAAVKEIRSVRKWAYTEFGDERAIQFTVMATPDDLAANAEYIRLADQYVEVPGGSNNHNYANVDLIVDIAERTGAQAVWAGWGHASENPKLVEKLSATKSKIVFIGPPANAMRTLGDKIASTVVAQTADVPCIDWNGVGITVPEVRDEQGVLIIPDDIMDKATVKDAETGLQHAKRIGFPVMIKASEGGGGKGIRKVTKAEEFSSLFEQVKKEVPGSPIFIMKMMSNARHLEVQLLGDHYGNAISLFGRDCSVQRRHQKIIEEAPVTIAEQDVREAMEKAAVRLAKLVGYHNAGTVEYLYDYTTKTYSFLELNPRLQVEHPTTEMVTGVNIPAAQLQVAMGIPLSCIKDIRVLYGLNPYDTSDIDFDFSTPLAHVTQRKPSAKGHVIACRITAENPEAGFKPNSGKVSELNFRSSTNVWGYFSVNATGGIHEFADSQFGHIFSYGETRLQSRKNMIIALKELSIRGDFRTTIDYLITLLENEDFAENRVNTGWLDGLIANRMEVERPDALVVAICGAVSKGVSIFESKSSEYLKVLAKGQMPPKTLLQTAVNVDFIYGGVRYKFNVSKVGSENYLVQSGVSSAEIVARRIADGGCLILLDMKTHIAYLNEESHQTSLTLDGRVAVLEKENDPTKLRTVSPGKLVRYLVDDGAHLNKGDNFAEIEVMKMIMSLPATSSGIVTLTKQPGQAIAAGDVLANLQLDDPSAVQSAKQFEGVLSFGPPQTFGDKPQQRFRRYKKNVENVLDGYENYEGKIQDFRALTEVCREPALPQLELMEILSTMVGRIPASLESSLSQIVGLKWEGGPVAEKISRMESEVNKARPSPGPEADAYNTQLAPLIAILGRYRSGLKGHERDVLSDLLDRFYQVEKLFDREKGENDTLDRYRLEHKNDLDKVVSVALAHSKVSSRNDIAITILDHVRSDYDGEAWRTSYGNILKNLAALASPTAAKVALRARELLIYTNLPTYRARYSAIEAKLQKAIVPIVNGNGSLHGDLSGHQTSVEIRSSDLADLISANYSILDVLTSFFYHPDVNMRHAAYYTYVLHTYVNAYDVKESANVDVNGTPAFTWNFKLRDQMRDTDDRYFDKDNLAGEVNRQGVFAAFSTLEELERNVHGVLEVLKSDLGRRVTRISSESDLASVSPMTAAKPMPSTSMTSVNVANIALDGTVWKNLEDDQIVKDLGAIITKNRTLLNERDVRRVTFLVAEESRAPKYFTFKQLFDFREDQIIRHIEPALAYQLELRRMANFSLKPAYSDNRRMHLYLGTGRENPSDTRFFVRALVQPGELGSDVRTADFLASEGDRVITDSLDTLDVLSADLQSNTDCNHIYINFIPTFVLELSDIEKALKSLTIRNGTRLFRSRFTDAELRFVLQPADSSQAPYPVRFFIHNVTGYTIKIEKYKEVLSSDGLWYLESLTSPPESRHKQPVYSLHQTKEPLANRRHKAHLLGTTFVYDFPGIFRQAIQSIWNKYAKRNPGIAVPGTLLTSTELALDAKNNMVEVFREPGSNTVGMVAWILEMFTPENPEGRKIVVIANDITFQTGSFGPDEDLLFYKASQLARSKGLPRLYLSANSGARIGLADEIQSRFKIAWNDKNDPSKGFKYLYLTQQDLTNLRDPSGSLPVFTETVQEDGETRFKITDIVGKQHGLGVENLQGSGMIAGETSQAYKEIFTATLVTARSVGIGAYLVRLGQRTVQVEGQPIILTGSSALNKVLGREVYSSNLQLGGTQIMYKNGISHLTAQNDLDGVTQLINWLSYVPKHVGADLPEFMVQPDPITRDVEYQIPQTNYDPRSFIAGVEEGDKWTSGIFDKGSWMETLGGWAPGVVIGRARLGGIPMGVVAVEMRLVQETWPADPGNPESTEAVLTSAPQVWLPESAFKTAQAINDFNYGEQLPLVIFANWRGFSGGQNDLLKGILKYGSYIVDALRNYKQPIFVYVMGELRGGAWVVLDPMINPDYMEMYAETDARGGVLEPEGTVEIKYRKHQLLATMERLDPQYAQLKREATAVTKKVKDGEEALPTDQLKVKQLLNEYQSREKKLLPSYQQIALHFADLHDKPKRMWAKGVIRGIVDWKDSRRHFFWRVKRRMLEESLLTQILKIKSDTSRQDAADHIKKWYAQDQGSTSASSGAGYDSVEDIDAAKWIEGFKGSKLERKLALLRKEASKTEIKNLFRTDRSSVLEGIASLLKDLTPEERESLLQVSLF
ncbi:acetyl-coenzyme-A carboxylase [Gonapodya sp. JEL0774]|nr:acetyl-coenzyme-A carboxylase [Gonapodya sp. JEL0774]